MPVRLESLTYVRSLTIERSATTSGEDSRLARALGLLHLKRFFRKRKSPGHFSGLEPQVRPENSELKIACRTLWLPLFAAIEWGPPSAHAKAKLPRLKGCPTIEPLDSSARLLLRQARVAHAWRPSYRGGAAARGVIRSIVWLSATRHAQHRLRQSRRQNADRKTSAPHAILDVSLMSSNKNKLADMAHLQKPGGFHQSDALRPVFSLPNSVLRRIAIRLRLITRRTHKRGTEN